MTLPSYTAEASLYATSVPYRSAAAGGAGGFGSVFAQQLCRHLGQTCGGIDLVCCSGLRCTAPLGGFGVCVRDFFHCTPCRPGGWQICCPPPGFGLRCFIRRCLPTPLGTV
jgi:hypothetical protein